MMEQKKKLEPFEVFDKIVSWFKRIGIIAGIDFFVEVYKPSVNTYFFVALLHFFLACCLYTGFAYGLDELAISLSLLAYNIQGMIKYYSFIKNVVPLKQLSDFIVNMFYKNRNPSQNKSCLQLSVSITFWILKYGIITLAVTVSASVLLPLLLYPFIGYLLPILPVYIPGINVNEPIGYIIHAIFHSTILFIFVVGTAGVDLGFMTFVLHIFAMSTIFQNAVNDLNAKVKNVKDQNVLDVRGTVNNLIMMHDDYINFVKKVRSTFFEISLIQIKMATCAMCLLVYVILRIKWISAYFLICTAFFQVFEYSLLGTIVEMANDRIYDAIYDIWAPDLPVQEQKKKVMMLLVAQYPHNLTLGGMEDLNVNVFVDSIKTTYTLAMLLSQSQEI